MRVNIRAALAAIGVVGASLSLAGCGGHDKRIAASRPAPKPGAAAQAANPPSSRSSAAVWGVRAGLNVAALSCRGSGRRPVAAHYARMLAHHRGLLAAAYRQEQGKQGVAAFDRQQTRVYNTFANPASPARFCSTASTVAQRANGLPSPAFAEAAPTLFGELRASLRQRR